jgi:hypothetical protein
VNVFPEDCCLHVCGSLHRGTQAPDGTCRAPLRHRRGLPSGLSAPTNHRPSWIAPVATACCGAIQSTHSQEPGQKMRRPGGVLSRDEWRGPLGRPPNFVGPRASISAADGGNPGEFRARTPGPGRPAAAVFEAERPKNAPRSRRQTTALAPPPHRANGAPWHSSGL